MTDNLRIGTTSAGSPFTLPRTAVTETFAYLGKRGVGKTHTAAVVVEEMLRTGLQVVVVDPVGVWWGLRVAADGSPAGLPITILGGEHGDLPLAPHAGTLLADLVVDERLSVVLDLSQIRAAERTLLMADFCEQLYHRNRAPLHLMLDEADAFAPQKPRRNQERLLDAVDELVRRGRARGLGVSLATQRSAVISKDVLTQIEVLVALRTIAPQDRDAIDAWVKTYAGSDQREAVLGSLPSLPIGTAWFWSPGWLGTIQQVQVRRRSTFDSSRTPEVGQSRQMPRQLADVDLSRLRERLGALIPAAPEPDAVPTLHRRIADLQRQGQTRPAPPPPERVEVPVVDEQTLAALRELAEQLHQTTGTLIAALDRVAAASAASAASPHTRATPEKTLSVDQALTIPAIAAYVQKARRDLRADPTAEAYVDRLLRACWTRSWSIKHLAEAWGTPSESTQARIRRAAKALVGVGLLTADQEQYQVNHDEVRRLAGLAAEPEARERTMP